jgi:ABC-type oligopeptide transport system substrate-binding subunit
MRRARLERAALVAWAGLAATAAGPYDAGAARPAHAHREYFGRTQPPAEDVFRFANGSEPEVLDPALLSSQPDGRLARALFEGLVVPDSKSLAPRPGAARAWEISHDGRRYVFHLRTDARWTNGQPLTAGDFEWSWLRVLHPDTPARLAELLYPIANARAYKRREIADPARVGVHALDDSTLGVDLEAPTPYFLQLLTATPYLPVHRPTVERCGDRWTRPENIVSNGPFQLVLHRPNDRIVLERAPRYWDAAGVRLERIVAFASDDLGTMLNLYRAGVTDWNPSGHLPAQYVPYVQRFADFRSGPYLATYFYSFNVTRPPLGDRRVRRALALAVDRVTMTKHLLHDSKEPWGNIVAPGFADYPYPAGVGFDPEAARRLLAAAGFPGGRGFPSIQILFSTSVDHRKIAEAIQEMWKRELGIDVTLANQEFASYMRATAALEYDVARRSWIADYEDPSTFLEVLRRGGGNNRTGWGSAAVDSLLGAAAVELDPARRGRLLAAAEEIVLDEMPFLPIYGYRTVEMVAPYVRGWYPTSMDVHPLKDIWIDRGAAR